jgi:diguanylate cyclase (GGDEF)-like protein/PAS domain S-box-containing protein
VQAVTTSPTPEGETTEMASDMNASAAMPTGAYALPASSMPPVSHIQELLSAAAELTFLVDPDRRVVYASPTVASLLGHDPLQVISHPVAALVHPAHVAPLEGAIGQVLQGFKLGEAELRFPHHSGQHSLAMMVGFSLLGTGNNVEGVMVTAKHQITRAAVQAALAFDDDAVRSAAASSPLAIFLLDGRGRCVWINQTWSSMTGQESDEAMGLGWLVALHEDDRDGFRSGAAQAHQRKSGWRQQFRISGVDGDTRWVDGAAAPRFDESGAVVGYIVLLADVTTEVQTRAELNKRTTIVESTAEFVVMDDRNQRLVYPETPSLPLADTPPLPASNEDSLRPSLGALASPSQSQYLNEIRPAVLADGVWQPGTPAPDATAPEAPAPDAPAGAIDEQNEYKADTQETLRYAAPSDSVLATIGHYLDQVGTDPATKPADAPGMQWAPSVAAQTDQPTAFRVPPFLRSTPELTPDRTPETSPETASEPTPEPVATWVEPTPEPVATWVEPTTDPTPEPVATWVEPTPEPVATWVEPTPQPDIWAASAVAESPVPPLAPVVPVAVVDPTPSQPIAWNFDTPVVTEAPVENWTPPTWTQPDTRATDATATPSDGGVPEESSYVTDQIKPIESVYVGLVGPSGSVESIAAVSDSVLDPTEFEDVSNQLPATDTVTGLANRALFHERIRLAMHRMQKDGVSIAIMLPNLHGYSELRNTVGPKTGDDQLFVIAKRLEATIRQSDTVARIGDADFAVLGVGWFFPGDVENAARRFMWKIQEPVPSIGGQVSLAASFGIAMAQPHETMSTVLRRAHRARKMAYQLGAGRVYVDHGPDREPTQA